MSRAVYSVSFVQLLAETSPGHVEVPDGFVYVVREVDLYTNGSSEGNGFYFVGAVGQTIESYFTEPSALGSNQWTGRAVFEPGQTFGWVLTGAWDISIFGYQLTLP